MGRKLTLCVLGLCSLSSGCSMFVAAARNICAELRDHTEEWSARADERRAKAAAGQEDCRSRVVEVSVADSGPGEPAAVVEGADGKPFQLPPVILRPPPEPPSRRPPPQEAEPAPAQIEPKEAALPDGPERESVPDDHTVLPALFATRTDSESVPPKTEVSSSEKAAPALSAPQEPPPALDERAGLGAPQAPPAPAEAAPAARLGLPPEDGQPSEGMEFWPAPPEE